MSLWATIDAELSAAFCGRQQFFCCLSVFRGWVDGRQAANAVCSPQTAALLLLAALG